MSVDIVRRPGALPIEAFIGIFMAICVVALIASVIIFAPSNRREHPDNKSIFNKGERVTVRVNNASGIVRKVYYWTHTDKPDGWHYSVRMTTLDVIEFAEDELTKMEDE
jgi:hypothetical protein